MGNEDFHMRKLMLCLVAISGLFSLTGCVVYEPRPRVYTYRAYDVYDGPGVVVYHQEYAGGYYHRRYYR